MKLVYIYIMLMIICWTLNPFLKKILRKKLSSNEYLLLNQIIVTVIVSIYFIYLFSYKKCSLSCYKKLTKSDICVLVLGALVTISATILLVEVVSMADVSYVISNVQPIVIALTVFLGWYFLSEKITYGKLFGVFLVICGIFSINNF